MADGLDLALAFGQKCLESAPTLVVGSGLSMPHGLPSMGALRDELIGNLNAEGLAESDATELHRLKVLLAQQDLETALTNVSLSDAMTARVVELTWKLVYPPDVAVLKSLLNDRRVLPLSRLFSHLFQSTHTKVSVVTTNYDRLVEYAAAAAGFHHSNGFTFGYLGERQTVPLALYAHNRSVQVRTVEVWKVHGSLDWFVDQSGSVVSMPMLSDLSDCIPVIVTPGVNKYQKSLQEPFRSVLTGADSTLSQANAYLSVGFGFNDAHIQPKLVERCKDPGIPLVVLARTLSESAKKLLLGGHCRSFVALERHNNGTMMYCSDNLTGRLLQGSSIWQLESFLAATT